MSGATQQQMPVGSGRAKVVRSSPPGFDAAGAEWPAGDLGQGAVGARGLWVKGPPLGGGGVKREGKRDSVG
ncbi:hypothetical protein LTR36_004546 [Oleoguttula mirabilis]|uniref:Uncharacterized protein n=1 Tax=Oleoguttula mirabilis TaxID=1507867 RepID=A0AAV9JGC6_9PEZI|nr:hypothetical protein LTR36_004546 [Oleoguttula mirabilis]